MNKEKRHATPWKRMNNYYIVCTPSPLPFLLGGWSSHQIFEKRTWQDLFFFLGGGGQLFSGGCSFYIKKSETFNDKKVYKQKKGAHYVLCMSKIIKSFPYVFLFEDLFHKMWHQHTNCGRMTVQFSLGLLLSLNKRISL